MHDITQTVFFLVAFATSSNLRGLAFSVLLLSGEATGDVPGGDEVAMHGT